MTNKPAAPTRRLLEIFELMPFFSTVTGGDGPFPRKPSPESTRSAMERAGALPADTLFVGDSHVDVRTARAAGVQFCLAGYGFGVENCPRACSPRTTGSSSARWTCWTGCEADDWALGISRTRLTTGRCACREPRALQAHSR